MNMGWQVILGTVLVLVSALLYLFHFLIFHDAHHIFLYLLGDIAFVPVEVLLVTLIIHKLLNLREKKVLLEKLNMIIGAFFSEIGTDLLKIFSDADPALETICGNLVVKNDWDDAHFEKVYTSLRKYDYGVDIKKIAMEELRDKLLKRRDFMVRLLENPNLLEHESFTGLLWAVFHLTEEMASRKSFADLPGSDLAHMGGDIKRAYHLLVHSWLDYMRHLKDNYPYLFSLAMRRNPFDEKATPVIT
ncbi:MAG: hypothetical protein JXJ19_04575 [Elusimicrobia bacterium]|nr:hypothetical protein [Elusimicrobiota bacterium]